VVQGIKLNKELGYLRIGAAVPSLRIADVNYNVNSIIEIMRKARIEGVQALCFPEMAITGYTLGDLVQHQVLLKRAEQGLTDILKESSLASMLTIIGMPLMVEQKIFNTALIINKGSILGVIPKTYLPNYKEFYDARWFESAADSHTCSIELAGQQASFGTDILFKVKNTPSAIIGIEICEDLWVPFAPHEYQSIAGANILFNLSASNEVLGKADWRRTLLTSESGRCFAAFCYVSSGVGESSNDMIFGGHAIIAEDGLILKESKRLQKDPQLIIADIDLDRLAFDRRAGGTFQDATRNFKPYRIIETEIKDIVSTRLWRQLDPHPFVPADLSRRSYVCRTIFSMQVEALSKKLSGAKKKKLVLGISGGLDSTLALLAAAKAMDTLGLPRTNIFTFTLPGFGTTRRTKNNATKLCKSLGVNLEEVSITRTCLSQFKDLKHSGNEDVVFENVQARYRTAFLFNKANELDAIVLGTGDLTEVALGWSTFAGDQTSHYHINVSVPKTLVRFLIRWVVDEELSHSSAGSILDDILNTPISPELLRPQKGAIAQKSEDIIGPVELADFYLYPFIRFGIKPGKILYLANETCKEGLFDGKYTLEDLYKWLKSFISRFFANQFKRTNLPEGPKIGSVSLSPRSDWRMPSDAEPTLWLEDLDEMYNKLSKNQIKSLNGES
jgi:NAD+ synthase (glutamine-hydrolysing)